MFNIYFCLHFDGFCQRLVFEREAKDQAIFPPKFEFFKYLPIY